MYRLGRNVSRLLVASLNFHRKKSSPLWYFSKSQRTKPRRVLILLPADRGIIYSKREMKDQSTPAGNHPLPSPSFAMTSLLLSPQKPILPSHLSHPEEQWSINASEWLSRWNNSIKTFLCLKGLPSHDAMPLRGLAATLTLHVYTCHNQWECQTLRAAWGSWKGRLREISPGLWVLKMPLSCGEEGV